jgi:hypothetical protein
VSGAGWDGGQARVGRQCDGETERVRVLRRINFRSGHFNA